MQNFGSSLSLSIPLFHGVPQGYILGPLLFLLCTSDLYQVIGLRDLFFHCCADDTQLYFHIQLIDTLPQKSYIENYLALWVAMSVTWLQAAQWIDFKVATIAFKALNGQPPSYLITVKSALASCRPGLPSSSEIRMLIPQHFNKCAERSFAVAW